MAPDPEHDAVSEPNTTCIIQDSTKLSHDTDTGAKVSHNACDDDDDDDDMEWKFKKNLYVLGITFCLLFLSYLALSDLQSSLFIDEGLGVVCQAVLYCSFAISCLFLPPLMIRQLGHKWTIVVAQFTYVIWMSANGYATWLTMTIASLLTGMGAAVLWTSFASYINVIAGRYAVKKGKSTIGTTSVFFGTAFALFRISRVFGSLLSWGILQNSINNATVMPQNMEYCGASDCPWSNTTSEYYAGPPKKLLWLLVGCFVVIGISSILVNIFCLDSLPENWHISEKTRHMPISQEIKKSLMSASKLHGNVRQLLLIPTSLYYGVVNTFIMADFSKSFVTCTSGIWMVGLVLLPHTVMCVLVSLLSGNIGRYVNSLPQFCVAFVVDCTVLLTCLFWKPQTDQVYVLFILSMMLGISVPVWNAQTCSLIGFVFPTQADAGFANYMLWQAVGFTVMFATSNLMCVDVRIYLTLALLVTSIICIIILNRVTRKRKVIKTMSEEGIMIVK